MLDQDTKKVLNFDLWLSVHIIAQQKVKFALETEDQGIKALTILWF